MKRGSHARTNTALKLLFHLDSRLIRWLASACFGFEDAVQKGLVSSADVQRAAQAGKAFERHCQAPALFVHQMRLAQPPGLGFVCFEVV
ncbi:hypothetical protein D3C72_1133750 [compost metagenome]